VDTTKWKKESAKKKPGAFEELLKEAETAGAEQLIALSNEAINLVVIQTLTDPEIAKRIRVLERSMCSMRPILPNDNI
jgi:hypothetical protein